MMQRKGKRGMQRPWRNIDWQSAIIMWLIAQNEKVM